MNKLTIMVVTCFFAAFGAGLLAGRVWERQARPGTAVVTDGGTVVTPVVETVPSVNPNPQAPVVKIDVENPPVKPVTPETKDVPPGQPTPPNPPGPPPSPNRGGPGFGQPGQPGQWGPPSMDNWLAELKLSPEQSEKMKKIWSDVMKNSFSLRHEKHDAIRKEKDESIKALFTDEQRQNYENILKTAENKYADIERESKAITDRAVVATREMLTPEQLVKYDEFRKKREQMWHRGGRPSSGGGGPPDGGRDNSGRDFNKDGGRDPRSDRRQK